MIRQIFLCAFMLLASACATTVPLQAPPSEVVVNHSLGRVPELDQTAHVLRHLDDNKVIVYLQQYGGGGVGLGLLAGPLGVLANQKMIEQQTEKDVAAFFGKVSADPEKAFREIARFAAFDLGQEPQEGDAVLSPYVYVVKQQEDTIGFASALLVDYRPTGEEWLGKYMYQLPTTYSPDELQAGLSEEQLNALRTELRAGFISILQLYTNDKNRKLDAVASIKVRSDFISNRFSYVVQGEQLPDNPQRLTIRTNGGIYSLDPAQTEIK